MVIEIPVRGDRGQGGIRHAPVHPQQAATDIPFLEGVGGGCALADITAGSGIDHGRVEPRQSQWVAEVEIVHIPAVAVHVIL